MKRSINEVMNDAAENSYLVCTEDNLVYGTDDFASVEAEAKLSKVKVVRLYDMKVYDPVNGWVDMESK